MCSLCSKPGAAAPPPMLLSVSLPNKCAQARRSPVSPERCVSCWPSEPHCVSLAELLEVLVRKPSPERVRDLPKVTQGAVSHSSVMPFHSWGAMHETVRASPLHTLPGLAQGVRSSSLCSFSHTRNARRCAQHLVWVPGVQRAGLQSLV